MRLSQGRRRESATLSRSSIALSPLEGLDDAGRARAIDALHATMAAHETRDGVLFESAAWITETTQP